MSLFDFLQGASNAAASNVSGPVDLIAWGLRKAGLPVNKPVLGSEWMAEQGLTRKPQNQVAGLLGEAAGLSAPIAAAAKAPQIAAGLLSLPDDFQAYNKALGPAGASYAINPAEARSALVERRNQLMAEADDWAARKYKANNRTVAFEGDGPGPEAMRIGSINENRRVKNVTMRDSQIREIDAVLKTLETKPERLEMAYDLALQDAQRMAALQGQSDFSPYLERYLDKAVTGNQDALHGPGSLGYALRMAVERAKVKPAATQPTAADDFLSQLFGGQ